MWEGDSREEANEKGGARHLQQRSEAGEGVGQEVPPKQNNCVGQCSSFPSMNTAGGCTELPHPRPQPEVAVEDAAPALSQARTAPPNGGGMGCTTAHHKGARPPPEYGWLAPVPLG